jgi:lipoprotein-releasing system permease protein
MTPAELLLLRLVVLVAGGFLAWLLGVALVHRYARFVGWRYLFRRRRSRTVALLTVAFGLASVALPAAFLLPKWPPGSLIPSALAILTVPSLLLFTTFLFLNLFSVFTTISITGVFCGVAALVVVLSVTSGFEDAFQSKVLGVNAHVIVLKYGLDFSEYRDVIKKVEKVPHVQAAAPFVFNEMMIAHGPSLSGVIVKGIVPGVSNRVLDLDGHMVEGKVSAVGERLAPTGGGPPLPGILLGRELAKKLKVKVGDTVRVVSPLGALDPSINIAPSDQMDRAPKMHEFRVGGIFYWGFDEYDRRLVCIALPEAQAFLGGGDVVTGVELRLDDIYKARAVAGTVDAALGGSPFRTIDWRELNHNLFTALRLQKLALAILLTLIVLVAAFGIVATLTMLVIDKTREIAILKSLGMRSVGVARVFQTAGMTIGALGTASGIGIGLAICYLLSHYGYRLDPRVYLIDRLPVRVDPAELLLTAAVTLGICFLATIYPSVRASSMQPVEGLRYE